MQNILGASIDAYVDLIGGYDRFAAATRAACYRWVGKTLAVVTDGEVARSGCPQLAAPEARRDCEAGARSMDDALVTFS